MAFKGGKAGIGACGDNRSASAVGCRPVSTLKRYVVVAIDACRVGIDANVVCHCASAREVSSSLPRPASRRVRVSLRERTWLSALRSVRASWSCSPRRMK